MTSNLIDPLINFLAPTGIVALAEIGDKTQLLALVLASRFKAPWAIISGILVATLLNHWAAAAFGYWVAGLFTPTLINIILFFSFAGMAIWTLIPDKLDEDDANVSPKYGAFITTVIAFFLAEMGDKTQIATIMLPAQYPNLYLVVAGTTVGMLIANVPVVLAGHFAAEKLPLALIRKITAALFGLMALYSGYLVIS